MAEILAANQITIAKVLDGEKGEQGIPGIGTDGKTSYFHIKYSAIANPTSSSQMTEEPSTYIGTYVDFTEADSTDPTKYTWSRFEGMQGEKGEQGIPGIGTDGKTSYLHIAYATSADGSEGFSISESANKTYIGQYTDFVSTDSTDPTKYAWTKIKGEMSPEQVAQLNNASQDASAAVSKVDNLEIGGRNLLTNPVYFLADGAVSNGITFNRTSNPSAWKINGTATSRVNVSLIGFTNTSTPADSTILLKEGQTYTASVKVEGSWADGAYIAVGISNSSGSWLSQTNLYPNTAKSHTFTATAEQYALRYWTVLIPSGESVDCTIYLKFELGDKATDWTPAPEDVDAGINNAAKVATNFINYDSTNGLVLGNKESGSWVGYRTQIDNDSFNVLDENGNIIASYGSNEVELGKGNPNAIIKMCDGKAYVKNYIVGSQNTSVFCGQDVTVVGEWEGASEAYALFKQGFVNIGQSGSHIIFTNETDNENHIEIQGQNITMRRVTNVGDFNCYMDANFKGSVTIATPLPISSGGTGATTAAVAVSNLGINDYIVEEGAGTDSGSYYRKWASGRAEYWHKFNPGAYTIGTARGNMYSGAYFDSSFESGLFNAVPQVNCYAHLSTDAYVIGTQVKTISKNSVTLRLWASGSIASNSGYNVHIYAFGTWK